ncbi:hypothetical protein [Paenibacillus wynnii]|nr:hypothetical protein [Paenibacillus wynnii]
MENSTLKTYNPQARWPVHQKTNDIIKLLQAVENQKPEHYLDVKLDVKPH